MNLTSPSQVKAWCIANEFHPNKVLGQNFLIDQNAVKAIVEAGLGMSELANCRMSESEGDEPSRQLQIPPEAVPSGGIGDAALPMYKGRDASPMRPQEALQAPHSIIRPFDHSIISPEVLEIGPGLGVLTEELLARGCRVTAVEKDPVLAARLADALGNPPSLTVVAADALDWIAKAKSSSLPLLHSSPSPLLHFPTSPLFSHMVSNLPYQAGTRILLELVKTRALPALTVLVQSEVAERLAAGPGSKARGLAGVWAQLDYDVRIVRKVSASCFWPRPEVGSSVVRLDRHGRNDALPEETRKVFFRLTKRAFEHRRKQLGSVFRGVIESTARAEELANDDWVALAGSLPPDAI